MNLVWSYLQNPFDNRTKRSNKLMNTIATDHHDRLLANKNRHQDLENLYIDFLPFYQSFKNFYTEISTNAAFYKGNTQSVETLLLELRIKKSVRWEAFILSLYDMGSVQYTQLLPTGRKGFYEGSYESRINELASFVQRLSKFPDLANAKTDAEQFLATLTAARTAQQGTEGTAAQLSTDLENARKALAERLHYHFAILLSLYYKEPTRVEDFFQMEYLTSKSNISSENEGGNVEGAQVEISIPAGSKAVAFENEVVEGDEVEVTNLSSSVIHSYSAINKQNDAPLEGVYTIEAGQSVVFRVGAGHRVIVCENLSTTQEAKASVAILVEKGG